ncbi:MAG TPA: hypothetical protein VJL29_07945 [Thermoguttaceae bacterium]|nr:hypothetical protein [Thermoguttaceae bacterium]
MNKPTLAQNQQRLIDWRMTGILAVLFIFHLSHVAVFGFATRFSGSFGGYGGRLSFLEMMLVAPQYCLPTLPAIWAAMAGSSRPWRLMIISLLGLHLVFLAILASIYWRDYVYRSELIARNVTGLFLLMLFSSLLLLIMRLWGWNMKDTSRHGNGNVNPLRNGLAESSATGSTDSITKNFQFSLTSMLLWMTGLTLLFSVMSTLWMNYVILERNSEIVFWTMSEGCGVAVLTPLVLRVTLCETMKNTWPMLLLLLGLSIALVLVALFLQIPNPSYVQFILIYTSTITGTSIIWTGLQLLLIRSAGYRLVRAKNSLD